MGKVDIAWGNRTLAWGNSNQHYETEGMRREKQVICIM
jgi:hypothetical protein